MNPQELREVLRGLGVAIGTTTLQNYRVWGLITPPVTRTLGRGKGRVTAYEAITPGEIYAAFRMMKSDLGFSIPQIRRFRAYWSGEKNPDHPWPPDLLVRSGALLWGLLRSVANHGRIVANNLNFHVYPAEEVGMVWQVLRQEAPGFLPTQQPDFEQNGLMGLIVIRGQDGEARMAAAMYPDHYDILARGETEAE